MYSKLDFSHEEKLSCDELIKRIRAYQPDADLALFKKAFAFSQKAHEGQKRSSGEEYFIHPCNVTAILIKLRLDIDGLMAGLLHDVIEDCHISADHLRKNFPEKVVEIVIGLTKISQIEFKNKEESQAENFRKIITAMAKDLRVIIVKLADRIHNMKTLEYIKDERQKNIAQETLDIYVPLAGKLGINSIKSELENLCLKFLHPKIYYRLVQKVEKNKEKRDEYIKETINILNEKILEYSIKVYVEGRQKTFYSIFRKMYQNDVDFDQLQGMLLFKIVVNNITECYKVLGIIHSHFTPIPGKFKDYIAIPKINGHQSLHTVIIGPKFERIEIQIKTHEMDEVSEIGVLTSLRLKNGIYLGEKTNLNWIQELLELNKNILNNSEFIRTVKNDLDMGEIFVFTPKGDVKELPYGATPLDFSYAVHTDIGHRTIGAKVNGKMVTFKYSLKSGDTIEILTDEHQVPSKNWMNIAKTSKARTKIKQWILKSEREKNKIIGKEIFHQILNTMETSLEEIKQSKDFEKIITETESINEEEFYIKIGLRKVNLQEIIKKMPFYSDKKKVKKILEEPNNLSNDIISPSEIQDFYKKYPIIVHSKKKFLVRIARCCNPIPGDTIVGYVKREKSIIVHTANCSKTNLGDVLKTINVEWNPHFSLKHPASIRIVSHDRPGILSIISESINNVGINIRSASAKSTLDCKGSFIFEIEVSDHIELLKVIDAIESLKEVISVTRE